MTYTQGAGLYSFKEVGFVTNIQRFDYSRKWVYDLYIGHKPTSLNTGHKPLIYIHGVWPVFIQGSGFLTYIQGLWLTLKQLGL